MFAERGVLMGVLVTFLAVGLAGCTTPTPGGKEELKIGTIFPLTGSLQNFGQPVTVASDLAATQINGAADAKYRVRLLHEDSQTEPAAGTAAANKLRTDGAVGVVGADASGVSRAVYGVTGPNRMPQISPMSTSPQLTDDMKAREPNDRFFFRTSPSDALQGAVAGQLAVEKKWSRVVLLYDNNPYGNGLRATFTGAFQGATIGGGGTGARTVAPFAFEEKQPSYDSVLQQAFTGCTSITAAACPSGVFFAGYPTEATQILKDWWARPEWRSIPWQFSEGVQDQPFFDGVRNAGIKIAGFDGTAPVGVGPGFGAFKDLLGSEPTLFQAHTYDAVFIMALAAEKAGRLDGQAIRDAIRGVAAAPGERVGPGDYNRAVQLVKQGTDVDYEGAAGSQNFDEFGDPTSAYEVYYLDSAGKIQRRCLVPEEAVVQTPVALPAECVVSAPTPTPGPAPPPPPPPPGPTKLDVTARQSGCPTGKVYCWDPENLTAPKGATVEATMNNPSGNIAHSLCFTTPTNATCTPGSIAGTPAGQSAKVAFSTPASPGTMTYYCAVPGHREIGMEGTLTIT